VFQPDKRFDLTVVFRPAGEPSGHVCDNCLADMMMAAVESFSDSPVIASYRSAFHTASERDAFREECDRLRAEKVELIKRLNRADDTIVSLEQKLVAANEQVSLQETLARNAAAAAEATLRRADAAREQQEIDTKYDPDYVAAVAAREKKRAGGR
jgi:hypothetical protein